MTTQDQQPAGQALPQPWPEGDERCRDASDGQPEDDTAICPPDVDPADVATVRRAFHLSLAQLAAIFGIPLRRTTR